MRRPHLALSAMAIVALIGSCQASNQGAHLYTLMPVMESPVLGNNAAKVPPGASVTISFPYDPTAHPFVSTDAPNTVRAIRYTWSTACGTLTAVKSSDPHIWRDPVTDSDTPVKVTGTSAILWTNSAPPQGSCLSIITAKVEYDTAGRSLPTNYHFSIWYQLDGTARIDYAGNSIVASGLCQPSPSGVPSVKGP